jgi:hypothetical protein
MTNEYILWFGKVMIGISRILAMGELPSDDDFATLVTHAIARLPLTTHWLRRPTPFDSQQGNLLSLRI